MATSDLQIKGLLADRPVLVTGAAGFVGSHLTEKLVGYGARVHVFVRATSSASHHNLLGCWRKIKVHRGDLADKQAVMVALKALKADGPSPVIFHLGGQAHVGESWERPYETLYTNVLGTINLLQSVVDIGLDCHRIDVAGSSEEYGNVNWEMGGNYRWDTTTRGLILDERSPLNPKSVYGVSKIGEDFLARAYFAGYNLPTVVTRMFNNYGPRQSPRFITGTIITQALERAEVHLGYMNAKRDFCFVQDGVRGHLHATMFGTPGEVYVYGSGQTTSIQDWYDMIIEIGRQDGLWQSPVLHCNIKGRGRLGHSEVEELRVDYKKLNALSGWAPEYDRKAGLRETITWYAQNRQRWIGRVDW